MPVYRTYNVTPGTFIAETLPNSRLFNEQGTADWFTPIENPYLGNLIGYEITAPSIGSYTVAFTELVEGEEVILTIVLNVIAEAYNLYANCCGDRNIAWLNIQGGWQNYVFSGIKTFQVEVEGSKQFKNSNLEKKHSQIDGVYTGEIVTTGDIPKAHVDALDGLRYSIQAFLYNDDTEAWDIPILIEPESFTKYKSNDKFYEVRIKFIYAEEILVQTQ